MSWPKGKPRKIKPETNQDAQESIKEPLMDPSPIEAPEAKIEAMAGNGGASVEALPGTWETRQIGSVGRIYASFDEKKQFWVEYGKRTGRHVKINLIRSDLPEKPIKETIVDDIQEAKPESVRAYWPSRPMDRDWLYNGRNPFYGASPRPTNSSRLSEGVSMVSVTHGKG